MTKRRNGDDLRKWYIAKMRGHWLVMPPVSEHPRWFERSRLFPTGAEALAAFAKGGQP